MGTNPGTLGDCIGVAVAALAARIGASLSGGIEGSRLMEVCVGGTGGGATDGR